MTLLLFLLGLVALVVGAELLVRGAAGLAAGWGISPLVVGLTVVAFGTSAPELAVSLGAAWQDQAALAIGNVVGSNIANVLLILGLSALVSPLLVDRDVIRRQVPLMIGASILFWVLAADGSLVRWEGLLLVAGGAALTWWTVSRSRRESATAGDAGILSPRGADGKVLGLQVLGGLVLLVLGSRWLVAGATALARTLGVSDLLVGLTVVAVGTSLPELATSVLASWRGQRDIAVGNVVGSNLFNILFILGLSAALAPAAIAVNPAVLAFDLPVMLAVAVACLPIFFTGHLIARWEGALFFAYYIGYTAYLVMSTMLHRHLDLFQDALFVFFLPLTLVTLAVSLYRHRRGSG